LSSVADTVLEAAIEGAPNNALHYPGELRNDEETILMRGTSNIGNKMIIDYGEDEDD
jgi:hypothetical protein